MPDQLVKDVAVDGLWQTLMLAGVLEHTPLQGEVLSYEAPTYYGMLVAAFEASSAILSSGGHPSLPDGEMENK